MNPRTYSLIAASILILLGATVLGSLIAGVDFFHRELAIAFPEKTTAPQVGIDRAAVARIARAINQRGTAGEYNVGATPPNEIAPVVEQSPSDIVPPTAGPREPGAQATTSIVASTTSTTTKTKNSPR